MGELPLAGRRIVVTRPREHAEPLAAALAALGAEAVVVPLIRVDPVADDEALEGALNGPYDWLVVTSANTVRALGDRPAFLELARSTKVAAVGPATAAALGRVAIEPAFVPDEYAAEHVVAGLGPLAGSRILLTQSDVSDSGLADRLRECGASVEAVDAYRTTAVEPSAIEVELLRRADAVILASGSAARSVAAAGGAGNALLVCIGPKTAHVASEVGLRVGLVADEATTDGIIRALVTHFGEST